MATQLSDASYAQPNLTPILDMVFQLITFFMLVINFKTATLDRNLSLPVVGSARPVDNAGREDVLVLNIDAAGRLMVFGEPRDMASYIASEARASQLLAKRTIAGFRPGGDLPTTVVVRADRAVPFSLLNQVFKTCQMHGYRRFTLKTARPVQS
jgi:biopolymer transport protein ExbD